jgi:hypothetical protein
LKELLLLSVCEQIPSKKKILITLLVLGKTMFSLLPRVTLY